MEVKRESNLEVIFDFLKWPLLLKDLLEVERKSRVLHLQANHEGKELLKNICQKNFSKKCVWISAYESLVNKRSHSSWKEQEDKQQQVQGMCKVFPAAAHICELLFALPLSVVQLNIISCVNFHAYNCSVKCEVCGEDNKFKWRIRQWRQLRRCANKSTKNN